MPHNAGIFAPAFAAGLLRPEVGAPAFVCDSAGRPAGKRYDVYRNNVTMGLARTLESIFPAVRHFVGEAEFRGVAIDYVRAEPPASPLLFDYGRGFPDWLERVAPPQFVAFLPDLARLERLWLDAWHAGDAAPLDPAALGAIAPDRLAGLCFVAHPAAAVSPARCAAVSLLRAGRGEGVPPENRLAPEDALITRPALDVQVRFLPPGGAAFLAALLAGCPLGEAAGLALADVPDFDVATALASMLEAGVFAALRPI